MNNPGLNKKELLLLFGLFLAAFLVRLYFLPFYRVISADGVGYVTAARSLLQGNFSLLTIYGVVYPSLTAAVSCFGINTETAGRLVSAFTGSLLVFPLYLLARDFFNRAVGIIACILIIAWPSLRSWAGEVMTQSTYITLLVTWYWLLWQAYRRGSVRWGVGAGIVAGLSYLTRPESLVAFACMAPILLFPCGTERPPRRRFILAASSAGGFILMLVPFVILVHDVTGHWQLAGKTGATLADALSEYLGRPDLKNEPGFQGIGIMDVIRDYPGFIGQNMVKNLGKTMSTMVPWYFWALAAFGSAVGGWTRDKVTERLFLLASFAPLVIIIMFFFVGPEYLQPYLPVLFLWVGQGMQSVERLLLLPFSSRQGVLASFPRIPVAVIAASILSIISFVGQVPKDRNKPYHFEDDGGRYDQRRIGTLLKQHLPPGSKIMTRWGRISFYAEMENSGMPQAGLAETLAAARKNGVRFIIIDGMLLNARPQYEPLFAPLVSSPESILYNPGSSGELSPVAGLRLFLLYKDPSSLGVAVYELVP